MKIEIAEHGRMAQSGSALLRIFQNQSVPLLDLVVRESIQNSLDAARKDKKSVDVNINVSNFNSQELNCHLEGVDEELNRRYPFVQDGYKFISFRDCNTVGLTGPIRYDDVLDNKYGNFLKLVYEISKPQENEGSGGSWGLGKTIFFRLGIGLVIYYSRIYNNGEYQSRLAACFVEDETKTSRIIPDSSKLRRGIAWWGAIDTAKNSKHTIPITDENTIAQILKVFELPLYKGDETGTTVIVPYVNESSLLAETFSKEEEDKPYWTNKVEDYFAVAVQRWYAPRLRNPEYPFGPYLAPSINGKRILVSGMYPVFRIIRDLYIFANTKKVNEESPLAENIAALKREPVTIRNVLNVNNTDAGTLVFGKFNKSQLRMLAPDNLCSPRKYICNEDSSGDTSNSAIIMYTRKPGMIVGYDIDGAVSSKIPRTVSEQYIIGLFVANTNNNLRNYPNEENPMSLEEYYRQSEKADHFSWKDPRVNGMEFNIIAKVKGHISDKIKKAYTVVEESDDSRKKIWLGHELAGLLLPPEDYNSKPSFNPKPPKGGGRVGPKKVKTAFKLEGTPEYKNGTVAFCFSLSLRNKKCEIYSQVVTDSKGYEADKWEDDSEMGKPFPVEIIKLFLSESPDICNSVNQFSVRKQEINTIVPRINSMKYDVAFKPSKVHRTKSYITINPKNFIGQLYGKITLKIIDPTIQGSLDIREIENE